MAEITESPSTSSETWQKLRSQLTNTAQRAGSVIRDARTRRAALRSLDTVALVALFVFPVALLFWVGVSHLTGSATALPPVWITALVSFLVPAIVIGLRAAAARARAIDEKNALAVADAQLGLEDRLITAAEFIDAPERDGFMLAALEDAAEAAHKAESAQLSLNAADARPHATLSVSSAVIACALVILAVYWIGPASPAASPEVARTETGLVGDLQDPEDPRRSDDLPPPKKESREEAVTPRPNDKPPAAGSNEPQARPGALTEETKKTQGKTGQGSSSNASSSSGSSESRDTPSAQGQSSLDPKKQKKKKKPKKPKKKKPREAEEGERKKPERKSGATAGRGMASGSTKSPDASEWSSKDQVVSEDEADLETDEEVDDEFDDQDSRGGVQPQLRDRKPPVNRDLSIGFGNQKNPDANGRGGASEQKKSRGVASLVLGVSIPDHVKGRPNPGKTKVTQERVEPRREDASPLQAGARSDREVPVGEITQPELAPWMRRFLRDYYLGLRTQKPKE